MRALPWLLLSVLLFVDCRCAQPGCTYDNCKLLIDACRVEFAGGPDQVAECTGYDRPPMPPDWAKYCVDACNAHEGNGALASCIAGKAGECIDGGFRGIDAVIKSCESMTPPPGPQKSCDDQCRATQKQCDTKCSGGDPCDQCLRAGQNCNGLCTDAGWQACLDCSAKCGLDYVACSDHCPRE